LTPGEKLELSLYQISSKINERRVKCIRWLPLVTSYRIKLRPSNVKLQVSRSEGLDYLFMNHLIDEYNHVYVPKGGIAVSRTCISHSSSNFSDLVTFLDKTNKLDIHFIFLIT
jgi:hypothetical protein